MPTEDEIFESYRQARKAGGTGEEFLAPLYKKLQEHTGSVIFLVTGRRYYDFADAIANAQNDPPKTPRKE